MLVLGVFGIILGDFDVFGLMWREDAGEGRRICLIFSLALAGHLAPSSLSAMTPYPHATPKHHQRRILQAAITFLCNGNSLHVQSNVFERCSAVAVPSLLSRAPLARNFWILAELPH